MRNQEFRALVTLLTLFACGTALAGSKADIVVMTQNQYLGADLTPIIAAEDPLVANAEMIAALTTVSNNNYPERVEALAESILDKQPHLVALQEVYTFRCHNPFGTEVPLGRDACELFPNAFNNHLAETVAALGDEYKVAAVVQNLTLFPASTLAPDWLGLPSGFELPGVPLVLDPTRPPVFIEVIDRDVILRREDVATTTVEFGCARVSVEGCNFETVAGASAAGVAFNIERGFVGVDTTIDGVDYRFINTHLEVQHPSPDPTSIYFQTMQASELLTAIVDTLDDSKRYIVTGDFNSSPVDVSAIGEPTPYEQMAMFFTDIWPLRPGKPGFTCCELADLSNAPSQHDERIDIVFTLPAPKKVKARVLDAKVKDKTLSGLWPSDHASVSAELTY